MKNSISTDVSETGLTVDITPSSASNKIQIVAHLNLEGQVTSNSLANFTSAGCLL